MKLLRFFLTIFHVFILLLLAGTLLNSIIPPHLFAYVNLLSLLFPVFMILNVLLCIFWMVMWKKRAFVFIILTLLFYNPVSRWINFNKSNGEKPNLKIVSMNIKSGKGGLKKVYDYLENTEADLILAQEYGSKFHVPNYPYQTKEYQIVALNSKTEIIRSEKIATTGNGNSFYADIKFEGKIIRVINVYLNPFYFSKDMVRPEEDLRTNTMKAKEVVKRLIPTFKMHEKEISDIRTAVENSPYPVILAGDFNAVPNSYEYYKLGRGLTDAFMKVGRGSGTTFHDYKFPIRIDYIFTSKDITPISYKVDRSVKLSDHYPVIAEFKIDR